MPLLLSCKSLSSTDNAVWYPGNNGTVEKKMTVFLFPSFALHCNKRPEREHEYSTGGSSHTHTQGDGVCDYVSSDNCNLKITHSAPEGNFSHPGA